MTNSSIATIHWSTCQLTGAIMSTRSRASFLLEAVCFIHGIMARRDTEGWLCRVHGLPNQPRGVIHCPVLVRTPHIPFKLVSLARVVSGSSTPSSSTIFALQLLIAGHKQFRGGSGGQSPPVLAFSLRVLGLVSREYDVLVYSV